MPSILEVAESLDEPDRGIDDEQRVTPLELFFDRVRNIGSLNWQRVLVAVVAAALILVAVSVDAIAALAAVAALAAGLIAYEAIRFREARRRIRTRLA